MSGSRANPPRFGDRSSFDALNRTIEGLEARIEGLMGSRERGRDGAHGRAEPPHPDLTRSGALRDDPVGEIMQRQRAIETVRERSAARSERRPHAFDTATPAHPSATRVAAEQAAPEFAAREIAQALVGLRQDLKRDIAEGLGREMDVLRDEMRAIRQAAEVRGHDDDIRGDLQRLAQGISQLGHQSGRSDTDGLRVEFDELRSVLDGLAREDSVRRMETRWNGVEQKLAAADQSRDDELLALAYRLDELKTQIQSVSPTPALRDLEGKLHAMGQAVEALGRSVMPDDRRYASQFEGLDLRLDEISRAIAAGARAPGSAADTAMLQRLEGRIADLAGQLDTISHRPSPEQGLGQRLEALAYRIEEMANEKAAIRLEERLDQLSFMIEQSQRAPAAGADLAGYLTDISRKIDALDQGAVNDVLAERLDLLARRIEDLDVPSAAPLSGERFSSIEGRLQAIADRLDRTSAAPVGDSAALQSLEAQIAHLSTLISAPQATSAAALPADFDNRMATIEDYMATNDEYIIEAARQAAEAVMQAYQHAETGGASSSDMAAISALAEDLRTLEDMMRSSEERTARTFDALHDTLVQIAGRLEQLDAPRPDDRADERQSSPATPRVAAMAFHDDEYPFVDDGFDAGSEGHEQRTITADAGTSDFADEVPVDGEEGSRPVVAEAAAAATTGKKARGGLISGLARRFAPARKDAPAVPAERQHIDPAPSLDPGDEIAPEVANQLLEPGSGAPDVRKILERVRASQAAEGRGKPSDAGKADFIAAARRAARMAAEESDTISRLAPEKKAAGSGAAASAFSRHRRPILMAVGAILLAIMSYPLVNTLVRGDEVPATAPVEQASMALPAGGNEAVAPAPVESTPAAAPIESAQVEVIEGDEPLSDGVTVPADDIPTPTVEDTGMDTGDPVLAITGAQQLTRPADAAAETGGFEPIVTNVPTEGIKDVPVTDEGTTESVIGAGDPGQDVTEAITVPAAIEPASLAKSAGEGDSLALFELGARFTDGRGVAIDMAEAANWYRLSADRGFAPAQYRLGSLYEKGQGVERDLDKARALYEQAARQGNANASHNLAVLLATGGGKAPDYAAAAEWFKKAAELGVRDSQFNLAILYARGNGVKQDLEESYKWFAIAARDGDRDAAEKRDEVANAMKPEQLADAKARLDLWKQQPLDDKANSTDLPDEWVGKGTKTASVDMKKAIRNIQAILNNNGFNAGSPDGTMGPKTVDAIKAFQKSIGQSETGKIDDKLINELLKRNKQQG
ncbi:peptidoglycan-binding protein [Rhizobium sp. TRM96647]|uniref:peptidoglycan-binding protein n=1 Tax=unclassified Rhizobium TaxID=2613769 RepID=UPI0021E7FC18|nr:MULTISPECIES: peptidoglycan-binding protein [unclassified Rhizobium]MCV3739443.1 peptidoglycan-binding protein [Rhizobium sp. TRM96647]MCV3761095.1 peptidoglycan-binding protein [Rhizobium sp. TRM96650]